MSFFETFGKIILKLIIVSGGCLLTFVLGFISFMSSNLALNTFKKWDPIAKWIMVFFFGIFAWVPFLSPLWFYYIYPTTWVEKDIKFLI